MNQEQVLRRKLMTYLSQPKTFRSTPWLQIFTKTKLQILNQKRIKFLPLHKIRFWRFHQIFLKMIWKIRPMISTQAIWTYWRSSIKIKKTWKVLENLELFMRQNKSKEILESSCTENKHWKQSKFNFFTAKF